MTDSTNSNPHHRSAFKRVQPEALALAPSELTIVNIDIPTAVTMAIGKLPGLLALREQILRDLPSFDIAALDQLETYTLATAHAHALYLAASAPPEALARLTEEGEQIRQTLYSDAVALANRGLISGDRLGEFKAAVGYKNLAFDLLGLAALLRERWEQIAGKTALQLSELDRAELLGEELVKAIASRDKGQAAASEVTQQRLRTFTLFVRAYDQVRRAVGYLRWNEADVESVVPSLYAGRNARKKTEEVVPVASAGSPGDAKEPAKSAEPTGAARKPEVKQAEEVAPGMPGSSPFH